MTETTHLKTPRGKLAVAREWLDTGGIVRADAIVMAGLANTLEAALDENDRLRENLSHATISAQTFREEADRLREVIAEARADAEEGTKCTYSNGQVAQALDTLAILAKAVQS